MTPLKIGAALMIDEIPTLRDWLFEADRDLEIQDFVDPESFRGGWQATVDRAKQALDGFNGRIGIHGPYRGLEIDNGDAELQQIIARRFVSAVEAADAVGARQMVIHSPFNLWSHHHRHDGMGRQDRVMNAVRAVMKPMITAAETHGVTLVVENCDDAVPETRREMVAELGSKAVAVSIDTGHAQLSRRMYGGPTVDAYVRDAGEMLQHVHIQDLDGYSDRHWPPGDGEIEWRAVFHALAECTSNPHLVLELYDAAEIPKGFDYLRDQGLAI